MTDNNHIETIVDHFFRRESGKMVAVLTRIFGIEHLKLVEDCVQDALLEAVETWPQRGRPDNPSGWLFRVAKNRVLNALKRRKTGKVAVERFLADHTPEDIDTAPENDLADDALRMLFACCHPAISFDSQICLALKTLGGLGIPEIARALLTTEENVNKRLVRARKTLRDAAISLDIEDDAAYSQRFQAVLEIILLIFNEGYSSSKGDHLIRSELCLEAIYLATMLSNSRTAQNRSDIHALLALMVLNASRFEAREDESGTPLTLAEQNRTLWNKELIALGLQHLEAALFNQDQSISKFHLLALISAHHALAEHYESTDWKRILELYDSYLGIENSPVVRLNRSVALAHARGPAEALAELSSIEKDPLLVNYPAFYAVKAEVSWQNGALSDALAYLDKALVLAKSGGEKAALLKKRKSFEAEKNI